MKNRFPLNATANAFVFIIHRPYRANGVYAYCLTADDVEAWCEENYRDTEIEFSTDDPEICMIYAEDDLVACVTRVDLYKRGC